MENNLIKKQITSLSIFNEWLEKKEAKEAADEQFDITDYQFKKVLKELFKEYNIKRFDDDYLQIILRAAYTRKTYDKKKIDELFDELGLVKEDYQNETFIDEAIVIKEK